MSISYSSLRLLQTILEKKYPNKEMFNQHDILMLINEYETNKMDYINETTKTNAYSQLDSFVEYLLVRNIANFDSMVLLTSLKGTGKSSMAIQIGRRWCKLLGKKFDPNRNMAYTNAQVMDRIDNLNSFDVLIPDESANFALATEWAKKENRALRIKLAQVRTKHLLFILCFPMKIEKMEKTYLESFVNYWGDLFDRGKAAVYVRDKNPAHDSWRIKDFKDLGSYTEFTNTEKVKSVLSRHPNYWFCLNAPKVPELIYNKYLKTREYNVYNDPNNYSEINKFDICKALLIITLKEIMQRDSSISMKRLLLHWQNIHNTEMDKQTMESVFEDARMLINKIKEEGTSGQELSGTVTTTTTEDIQDDTGEQVQQV